MTGLRGGDGAAFAEWLSAPVTPWEKETREEDLDYLTQNFARNARTEFCFRKKIPADQAAT